MARFDAGRQVFRRGDNVLDYWIDHAEGFEVWSGAQFRARVEAVVVDPSRGRAKELVVETALFHRRRVIPVDAVVAVDPFTRRLEVERAGDQAVSRASRSLVPLVAAVVTELMRLIAWSGPRFRQATLLAYRGTLRLVRLAAAASAWLLPRLKTSAVTGWALGSALALRLGAALATWTKSMAARLGPRLAALTRTALKQAAAFGWLSVIGVAAALAWVAPRLAKAAAGATLTAGVAGVEAPHLVGTRVSRHMR